MGHNMIDAASGRALMDKTPATTRHLISNMVSNTQQFRTRGVVTNRAVNKVDVLENLRLKNQLTKLMSLVRQLGVSQHQQIPPVKICGICTFVEHPIDMCPTLQETESDNAEIVGVIVPPLHQQQQQIPTQNNSPSMEEWMKFQQNMNATMHDLKMQIVPELWRLEPTSVVIQLANKSVVRPVGILEDVLVQVNELIFLVDFYVPDMEDETSGKGSTLILGWPFLMTVRMKIDVYAGTLSMEFGDNLVQFNILEAIKHPLEDHSLYSIDMIEELVEEFTHLDSDSDNMSPIVKISNMFPCASSITEEADFTNRMKNEDLEVVNLGESEE
ncbi:hypothetical protein CR513_09261, partial [Mucuna pruriens]